MTRKARIKDPKIHLVQTVTDDRFTDEGRLEGWSKVIKSKTQSEGMMLWERPKLESILPSKRNRVQPSESTKQSKWATDPNSILWQWRSEIQRSGVERWESRDGESLRVEILRGKDREWGETVRARVRATEIETQSREAIKQRRLGEVKNKRSLRI